MKKKRKRREKRIKKEIDAKKFELTRISKDFDFIKTFENVLSEPDKLNNYSYSGRNFSLFLISFSAIALTSLFSFNIFKKFFSKRRK